MANVTRAPASFTEVWNEGSKVTLTPVVKDKTSGDVVSKGQPVEVTLEELMNYIEADLVARDVFEPKA